jgi:tRNA pseudouridine38-40 synthase
MRDVVTGVERTGSRGPAPGSAPSGPRAGRWLVRFGYDGAGFAGWARQPGLCTVEGTLRDGLRGRGIAPTIAAARLEVASRTDRAVSARANAVALTSELSAKALLGRLNSIAPALFFTAAAEVPPGFRARGADRRIYRYFDPSRAARPGLVLEAARLFSGAIDVRSFGREVPRERPTWREIESVTVEPRSRGRVIEVRAPSFVWGMVRKIVGALREVDADRLPLARLEAAVRGTERLTLPLAEPEGLVLWAVEYRRVRWDAHWTGPNRQQQQYAARRSRSLWQREGVVRSLATGRGARPARDDGTAGRPAATR